MNDVTDTTIYLANDIARMLRGEPAMTTEQLERRGDDRLTKFIVRTLHRVMTVTYPDGWDHKKRNDELRRIFLAAHPEWKGRIWIGHKCITVRGLGTTWWRQPEMSTKDEARYFLCEFERELT